MKVNMQSDRRYDIDWLRVIAIGMLLVYHSSIGFQPWGALIRFIQNDQFSEPLWVLMSMINIWRIPFLFFVSGMGVWFALRNRTWKTLIQERSKRILLPFLVGIFLWVPLHQNIWQVYYSQPMLYLPNPGHLWFLGNIFSYVLLLTPLFFFLKINIASPWVKRVKQMFSHPLFLLGLIIPFVLEAELMQPESFELYAMTWHGFFLGLVAFLVGFFMAFSGQEIFVNLSRYRCITVSLAVGIYLMRVLYFELRTPDYLMSIESCLWIYAIVGLGYRYLNRSSPVLTYLSQAAYPVYIIHMMVLYGGSVLIFPLTMNALWKLLLLNGFTFGGCFLIYELIIRRIKPIRSLFGLKSN
ncbi:MAG: acyltransferase [Cytophagales bacterium]|nr:acyltransferase [Cytophagales bacterium]